jgi:hypothetical protein
MKLPDDEGYEEPDNDALPKGAYILNPYHNKKLLTKEEALNAINVFSAMLLVDGDIRRHTESH